MGHRLSVFLTIFALTLFLLATLPKLVFNTSIYDMVIEDLEETREYQSFSTIAFPTVLAAGTTVLGLASLFVSRIIAIKAFALFACVGMISFVIVALTFLPAALSMMPRRRAVGGTDKQARSPGVVQRLIDAIVAINLDYRQFSLPLFAALSLFCLFGMLRLTVETNPVGYFRKDSQVRQQFDDIHQRLSGSFPLNVMVTGSGEDYFETVEAMRALDRFQTSSAVRRTIARRCCSSGFASRSIVSAPLPARTAFPSIWPLPRFPWNRKPPGTGFWSARFPALRRRVRQSRRPLSGSTK